MKNQKIDVNRKSKNNRKVFDVVDKVGNGIRKYGIPVLAFIAAVVSASKINSRNKL